MPGLDGRLRLGGVEQIGDGRDVAIVATGSITHEAAAAVELLEAQGWRSRLVVAACLSPSPAEALVAALRSVSARGHGRGALPDRWARLARLGGRRRVGSRMPRRPLRRRDACPTSSGARRSSTTRTACRRRRSPEPPRRRSTSVTGREPRRRPMKKLSAIIACYRDAPAVPEMYERLTETFRSIGVDYEIIFVNDASPDNAREVLAELAASRPAGGRRQPHARTSARRARSRAACGSRPATPRSCSTATCRTRPS